MLLKRRCNTITNKLKAIYEKKVYYFESNKPLFELWYHQESNRGHKDFQSFARDVGVGRSSRLIPTFSLRTLCSWCSFYLNPFLFALFVAPNRR